MAVQVLDDYYLAITLLITIGYQLFFFSIAFSFKFDKLTGMCTKSPNVEKNLSLFARALSLYLSVCGNSSACSSPQKRINSNIYFFFSDPDFAGGTNFAVLAITTLSFGSTSGSTAHARQIIASLLLTLWALRLSSFLLFRILQTGTDTRFDDKRDKFFPFLGFWVAQMLWVWIVSLPVTILNSPAVTSYRQPGFGTGLDIAGLVLWVIGFVVESVSDGQKYRFKVRVQDQDRSAVCDVGVFSWSRHPNYFGEIVLQFGIFMLAVSPSAEGDVPVGSGAYAAQLASILGPVFLTVLLLFVSGLTLQERPGAKRRFEKDGPAGDGWVRYQRWLDRTSILIPLPPMVYARLPVWVKRTLLLEFPIYVFDPEKHAEEGTVKKGQGRSDGGTGGGGAAAAAGDPSVTGDTQQQRQQGRSESGENLV